MDAETKARLYDEIEEYDRIARVRYEELLSNLSGPLESCDHLNTEPGPRHPLVFGSYATEVCRDCGRFRMLQSLPDWWSEWKEDRIPTFEEAEEGYS